MADVRCRRHALLGAHSLSPLTYPSSADLRRARPRSRITYLLARTQRAHWYPYFDDVDAIIFLAPISCFDERLAEDRRVNRLEDTYLLWRTLCSLRLLSKTQIILFLNKCDLLERKLRAGVRVREHVPSYGERSNDVGTVKKCTSAFVVVSTSAWADGFCGCFLDAREQISKRTSRRSRSSTRLSRAGSTCTSRPSWCVHPVPRLPPRACLSDVCPPFSLQDTKETAATLRTVEEGILRDSLRRADLL